MGEASTVLISVKEGDLWRVQIAWPNGAINYFGKFGSELEARKWISTHRQLTEKVIDDSKIRRPWGSVSRRQSADNIATGATDKEETDPLPRSIRLMSGRFPPPQSIDEGAESFKDAAGQPIAYAYFEDEPQRRIAANIAQLPAATSSKVRVMAEHGGTRYCLVLAVVSYCIGA